MRRTLVMLAVVAGIAVAAAVPAAGARPTAAGASTPQTTNCLPGSGSSEYCEPFCIVPQLTGATITRAAVLASLAGCRLGRIRLESGAPAATPAITAPRFGLFRVVRQDPAPGLLRPALWRIDIWVRFTG